MPTSDEKTVEGDVGQFYKNKKRETFSDRPKKSPQETGVNNLLTKTQYLFVVKTYAKKH